MKNNISGLQKMDVKELLLFLTKKREALGEARFDLYLQKLKDSSQIRKHKKEVAQILTVLNQKLCEEQV